VSIVLMLLFLYNFDQKSSRYTQTDVSNVTRASVSIVDRYMRRKSPQKLPLVWLGLGISNAALTYWLLR